METLRPVFYRWIGVRIGEGVQIKVGAIIDVWREGVPGGIGHKVSIGENTMISGGVTAGEIRAFYARPLATVGGVALERAVKAARDFIDVSLDGRKAPKVAQALDADEFSADGVLAAVLKSDRLPPRLLDVFRTPGDEFAFHGDGAGPQEGCLRQIMDSEQIDAVFLDSGEFSSLPEWEVVEKRLPPGGYVVLHDIFFPKSFKNWLVCGAIQAHPDFEVLYVDRSTPQGLMVAQKRQ